jgi:hypothetical protein
LQHSKEYFITYGDIKAIRYFDILIEGPISIIQNIDYDGFAFQSGDLAYILYPKLNVSA